MYRHLTPKTTLMTAALVVFSCFLAVGQSGNRDRQVLIHHIPQQINPAYAGSAGKSRIALNAHNLLGFGNSSFSQYLVGYDRYVSGANLGIGFVGGYDQEQGSVSTRNFTGAINLAWKTRISKHWTLSTGGKIGLIHQMVESSIANKALAEYSAGFNADQSSNAQGFQVTRTTGLEVGSGILLNTKRMHIGIANRRVISQPSEIGVQLYGWHRYLWSAEVGYVFQRKETSPFSIAPNMLFQFRDRDPSLLLQTSFRYKWLMWGVGGRDLNQALTMLGFYHRNFRIGYAYAANFGPQQGGMHEMAFRYCFANKKRITKGLSRRNVPSW